MHLLKEIVPGLCTLIYCSYGFNAVRNVTETSEIFHEIFYGLTTTINSVQLIGEMFTLRTIEKVERLLLIFNNHNATVLIPWNLKISDNGVLLNIHPPPTTKYIFAQVWLYSIKRQCERLFKYAGTMAYAPKIAYVTTRIKSITVLFWDVNTSEKLLLLLLFGKSVIETHIQSFIPVADLRLRLWLLVYN